MKRPIGGAPVHGAQLKGGAGARGRGSGGRAGRRRRARAGGSGGAGGVGKVEDRRLAERAAKNAEDLGSDEDAVARVARLFLEDADAGQVPHREVGCLFGDLEELSQTVGG